MIAFGIAALIVKGTGVERRLAKYVGQVVAKGNNRTISCQSHAIGNESRQMMNKN